jgi:hypothetical protein
MHRWNASTVAWRRGGRLRRFGHRPVLTRRQVLKRVAGTGALAVVGGGAYATSQLIGGGSDQGEWPATVRAFVSRPDLRPPGVAVSGRCGSPGFLFIGPTAHGGAVNGPLAVHGDGEPMWFAPGADWATNVRPDSYRDQPVLSWWAGERIPSGYGHGDGFIVDRRYRRLAQVRAGNRRRIDMHEFRLTPEGTALCTCYPDTVPVDLSSVGDPKDGRVYESIVQEVDIATGRVLLEWRSLDHIPISDSYRKLASPYDYMHANTVAVAPDGNLLISGRHTWSLYKVDRRTGEVIWRLGGKRSEFEVDPAARFAWQHDAQYPAKGMITMCRARSYWPSTRATRSCRRPSALRPAAVIQRHGFETAIQLGTKGGRFAVTALDSAGRPLGRSRVVAV